MQGELAFSLSESLSVGEFCDRAGISKALAYKLIRRGDLPAFRLSPRTLRIDLAALSEKLKAQTSDKTAHAAADSNRAEERSEEGM